MYDDGYGDKDDVDDDDKLRKGGREMRQVSVVEPPTGERPAVHRPEYTKDAVLAWSPHCDVCVYSARWQENRTLPYAGRR